MIDLKPYGAFIEHTIRPLLEEFKFIFIFFLIIITAIVILPITETMSVVKETYNRLRITIPSFAQGGGIKIEQTEERVEEEEEQEREEGEISEEEEGEPESEEAYPEDTESDSSEGSEDEEYDETIAAMKRRIEALEQKNHEK